MDTKLLEEAARRAEGELARMEMWVAMGGGAAPPDQLVEMRERVARARAALAEVKPATAAQPVMASPVARDGGDLAMGENSTGLSATVTMRMDRLATSMAHLFALHRKPLVTVEVKNFRDEIARVAVRCHIEGYSAEVIECTELEPKGSEGSSYKFDLFPPLFPERVRGINELTAAALHVVVQDLDSPNGKDKDKAKGTGVELIQARAIGLLPPTTAVLGYVDPSNGQVVDQRDLLAAWVTPNAPEVLELLRTAADFSKLKAMLGYQTDAAGVREHVRAIYMALNAAKIVYIDSRVAFGGGTGQSIQRIRLPRESLVCRSANCIDGTVLMASLLEATGIDPMIVLVPGHAYLGYRPDPKLPNTYEYVETTMIGTKSFDEAFATAAARTAQGIGLGQVKHLDVRKLRAAGITPME